MLYIGIESSCDETAAAVVDQNLVIQSNVVATQIAIHAKYGGVVPELASRKHLLTVLHVIEQAIADAGLESAKDLNGVVVTCGPGLVGSLLVGLQVAKSLSFVHGLPLVGVNHLAGHMAAIHLRPKGTDQSSIAPGPEFPHVALLSSGGHTALFLVESMGKCTNLGSTRDDAAGEAFDKVAKMLGLGYPGGPAIDRLASQGDPQAYRFPRAMVGGGNLEFSFSGLKTALRNHLSGHQELKEADLANVCASMQEAVADVLVSKALLACKKLGVSTLVLSGGVVANSRVRSLATERGALAGVGVHLPPKPLCTDNAAMIAAAGVHRLVAGEGRDPSLWLGLNASPNLPLGGA